MPILEILHYPDERLHLIAQPVSEVTPAIHALIDDMVTTMYAESGIGLAATQVNVQKQIAVIDISDDKSDLRVFVNPIIVKREGSCESEEGCLSVPGIFDTVIRSETITVQAIDKQGEKFTLAATGLLAMCIQHEIDHLQGKVFVDYLSRLKQTRIRAKFKKMHRKVM